MASGKNFIERKSKHPGMTLAQYYELARKNIEDRPAWRYGQSLFNTLLSVRPELAEKIRGTVADPFHIHHEMDKRLTLFTEFLEANW
jgi:hypothetical protein